MPDLAIVSMYCLPSWYSNKRRDGKGDTNRWVHDRHCDYRGANHTSYQIVFCALTLRHFYDVMGVVVVVWRVGEGAVGRVKTNG